MTDTDNAERPSWQRPPFEPQNELAVTHGAYSNRKVEERACDLVEQAVRLVSWLGDDAARPELHAWARAEARSQLLAEWLDEHGLLDEEGEPRPAAALAAKFERAAMQGRDRLGLSPLAKAKVAASSGIAAAAQAHALTELQAQGRRLRLDAEQRQHDAIDIEPEPSELQPPQDAVTFVPCSEDDADDEDRPRPDVVEPTPVAPCALIRAEGLDALQQAFADRP